MSARRRHPLDPEPMPLWGWLLTALAAAGVLIFVAALIFLPDPGEPCRDAGGLWLQRDGVCVDRDAVIEP